MIFLKFQRFSQKSIKRPKIPQKVNGQKILSPNNPQDLFVIGAVVGVLVGRLIIFVGLFVGTFDGTLVGVLVGAFVGTFVTLVGFLDGVLLGVLVGCFVGDRVGAFVGTLVTFVVFVDIYPTKTKDRITVKTVCLQLQELKKIHTVALQ
jgi:hypothetical protein